MILLEVSFDAHESEETFYHGKLTGKTDDPKREQGMGHYLLKTYLEQFKLWGVFNPIPCSLIKGKAIE